MAFVKKTWKDRIAEFPTRRRLTKEDNTSELVTVAREEGTLSQEGDAFSAENMNDLENRIDAEFTEVNGKLGIDLLWTNPSPTSIFEPQTLNIDLSSYKWVIIDFKFATSVDYFETSFAPIDGQTHIGHVVVHRIHYRSFIASSDKIVFDNGVEIYTYNTVVSNPSDAIPVKIFGVK